jgi:DNA-binding IclR family transcriptional regulator
MRKAKESRKQGESQPSDVAADAAGSRAGGSGQRSVQSVEVGGRLLLALAGHPEPMSLKDLAAKAGLPPSRAHPYLVSFGRLRLVEQEPVSGRYALGPAALQIGLACLHQSDPLKAALPIAEALAATIGQMVVIAVWGNFGPTVVRMFESRQPLHVNMRVGTVMSTLETATGRAFAAALPPDQVAAVLAGPFGDLRQPPRSRARASDASLNEIAAELKAHGVTRAMGHPLPGINAFSAPAFDHEGTPALVITALGHVDRFPAAWDSEYARAVKRAAAEVSMKLGFSG